MLHFGISSKKSRNIKLIWSPLLLGRTFYQTDFIGFLSVCTCFSEKLCLKLNCLKCFRFKVVVAVVVCGGGGSVRVIILFSCNAAADYNDDDNDAIDDDNGDKVTAVNFIIFFKVQDSRSLHYLVRQITLWHFDTHHNNRKWHCKINLNKSQWVTMDKKLRPPSAKNPQRSKVLSHAVSQNIALHASPATRNSPY